MIKIDGKFNNNIFDKICSSLKDLLLQFVNSEDRLKFYSLNKKNRDILLNKYHLNHTSFNTIFLTFLFLNKIKTFSKFINETNVNLLDLILVGETEPINIKAKLIAFFYFVSH